MIAALTWSTVQRNHSPSGFLTPLSREHPMYIMVSEHRPVIAHGGFFEDDPVRRFAGSQRRILLGNAGLRIHRRVADFQQPRILRVRVLVGVDGGPRCRARREEIRYSLSCLHRADNLFDERDLTGGKAIFRVEVLVRPPLRPLLELARRSRLCAYVFVMAYAEELKGESADK